MKSKIMSLFVIPAQAGIQHLFNWFPAFAGKTIANVPSIILDAAIGLLIGHQFQQEAQ